MFYRDIVFANMITFLELSGLCIHNAVSENVLSFGLSSSCHGLGTNICIMKSELQLLIQIRCFVKIMPLLSIVM